MDPPIGKEGTYSSVVSRFKMTADCSSLMPNRSWKQREALCQMERGHWLLAPSILCCNLICITATLAAASDWVSHTLLAESTSRSSSCFPQAKTCILNRWTIKTLSIMPPGLYLAHRLQGPSCSGPRASKVASLKTEVLHAKPAATKHALSFPSYAFTLRHLSPSSSLVTWPVSWTLSQTSCGLTKVFLPDIRYSLHGWQHGTYPITKQTLCLPTDTLTCLNLLLENQRSFLPSVCLNFVSVR